MPPTRRALRLAPSLLSADFARLGEAVEAADSGGADAFHLDVMDGHFVPNISFGPALVRAVRARTRKPLDIHLMIQHPQKYLRAFREAGGDTLVFHVEADGDPRALVREAHELGAEAGAALRPDTPFERVEPLLAELDQVQVMSVYPGFSGQTFRSEVLPKVQRVRDALDAIGSGADLSMDGGITVETARRAAASGATFFVCGNSVYADGQVADNLARLRESVTDGALHAVR
ncbi:MAG TPA: ribulose-phosphate 3-epimerase [Thermoplasmata archaeon]|nr:ribulose-phosphate 3-epimerase [Thermoplasmata archaeon]